MWAISVIFKLIAQSKQSPFGRKFAQSGYPESSPRTCTTSLLFEKLPKVATTQSMGDNSPNLATLPTTLRRRQIILCT
jgi:hypothetical protein